MTLLAHPSAKPSWIMPAWTSSSEVSTVGGKAAVIDEATARVPVTSPDVYVEVDFKVLTSASPMILGLLAVNTMGWTVCTKTCTVDWGIAKFPHSLEEWESFLYWKNLNRHPPDATFEMDHDPGPSQDNQNIWPIGYTDVLIVNSPRRPPRDVSWGVRRACRE